MYLLILWFDEISHLQQSLLLLLLLVQYLGIKDEDQLKFSTKSTKEY
jgi:hypothetical protein